MLAVPPCGQEPGRSLAAFFVALALGACSDDGTNTATGDVVLGDTSLSCNGLAPGTVVGCDGGFPLVCGPDDPEASRGFCPAGEICHEDSCTPIEGNVLVIMDTSGSMNWLPGRRIFAGQCSGTECPPWEHPACDDEDDPGTRIGAAKVALRRFVESPEASIFRIGLQRFPTRPKGVSAPQCEDGLWQSTSPNPGIPATVTGDTGARSTSEGGWLMRNLSEILVVPLAPATERDAIVAWLDWREETTATTDACIADGDCADGLCIDGACHRMTNPELRAVGGTPLGKSLFYAGEIFRHRILVEGRACISDPDCASPHHQCVEGRCHDPFRRCRPNAIIVFTDGVESDNLRLDDFFHPRVQAKRLFAGLGCLTSNDCGGATTCIDNRCTINESALPWPATTRVCSSGEFPCENDEECPNACPGQPEGQCASTCGPGDVSFDTDGIGDRLVGLDGEALSLRVHVVDASGRDDTNKLIAAWGGGIHQSVNAADPLAIVTALRDVIRDLKSSTRCLVNP